MWNRIKVLIQSRALSPAARIILKEDLRGLLRDDPGPEIAIEAMINWLCLAQDSSISSDGGVARDYSFRKGWASSYPETTGYIIPTFLKLAELHQNEGLRLRARRMLDWCQSIQLDSGGFQGGKIDADPVVPVTFNTGQILLGLASGVRYFDDYQSAMHKAAVFLRDSLEADGCWRKYPTPFAQPGEKAYETHVSWSLFEADRIAPDKGYGRAGMRQVFWAMSKQRANGWVADCCLNLPERPLTHTLGYFLKGLVEAYHWSNNDEVLESALRTARGLITALRPDGFLPGRVNPDWSAAVKWTCLTGNFQVADSWLYLGLATNEPQFVKAAKRLISQTRRTIRYSGAEEVRGGVQGSFPVNGNYGDYELLNWAAKFGIDACLSEIDLKSSSSGQL